LQLCSIGGLQFVDTKYNDKTTYDIIKTMAREETLRYTMHSIMKRLT
jgi:hypothetical protein